MAERALIDIIQIKSASDYAALFKKYADKIKWDNDALMAMYRQGLKDSVKDEFMQYRADFRNLGDFIRISIKLDDKIFFRLVKKWGIKPRYDRTGFAYQNYLWESHNFFKEDSMELDAV